MTDTDEPCRLSAEQVMAVFAEAGPDSAPLTTKQIAEDARRLAGMEPQRSESGRWHHEVHRPLAELVQAGELVTSRAKRFGKPWPGFDEEYRHLIAEGNSVERFYATPEQSARWARKLDALAAERRRADRLAALLVETGEAVSARADQPYAGEPVLVVTLTLEQATEAFAFGDYS